jgi:uncharacterized protein
VTTNALFAGVDRAIFAASFADRLRRAEVDVSFSALERCTIALDVAGPMTLSDLYWVCRLSFVSRHTQLDRFDAVFQAVFDTDAGTLRAARRGQQPAPSQRDDEQLVPLRRQLADESSASGGLPWATLPSVSFDVGSDDVEDVDDLAIPELQPSSTASEMQRPFDLLDEAELARVGALLESTVTQWPQRRTRRRRTTRSSGPIAMRRSLRRSMHTGGDVMTWLHSTPQRHPRNIVVLLDVSGSMEHYARAYLHLTRPLAIGHRAEVFAFATTLSRITPSVRHRSPAEAIAQVTDTVTDRFSGHATREQFAHAPPPPDLEHDGARCGRADLFRRLGRRHPGRTRTQHAATVAAGPPGGLGESSCRRLRIRADHGRDVHRAAVL